MKALKSVEEAAGLLGISKWTVREYIRTGKLRPVRLGRRVLVEESELERLVANGKAESDEEKGRQGDTASISIGARPRRDDHDHDDDNA